MEKFLENLNFSRLNQEEIENMNRLITRTEIKTIVKKSSNKAETSGQKVSQANSMKSLEKR